MDQKVFYVLNLDNQQWYIMYIVIIFFLYIPKREFVYSKNLKGPLKGLIYIHALSDCRILHEIYMYLSLSLSDIKSCKWFLSNISIDCRDCWWMSWHRGEMEEDCSEKELFSLRQSLWWTWQAEVPLCHQFICQSNIRSMCI